MSKLTENKQPDLAMSQECENRCIFAMLVVMCVTKQIDGFLGWVYLVARSVIKSE